MTNLPILILIQTSILVYGVKGWHLVSRLNVLKKLINTKEALRTADIIR